MWGPHKAVHATRCDWFVTCPIAEPHLVARVVVEGRDWQRALWLEHVRVGAVVDDDGVAQVTAEAGQVLGQVAL